MCTRESKNGIRNLCGDAGGGVIAHLFDVSTTVHMGNNTEANAADQTREFHAKHAITMVHADCVHDMVFVCIGSSLQMCHPPETAARLVAGCQHEDGFRDGHRGDARLSTVHGVAVDRNLVVFFTDCLNNCVRQVTTNGQVRTIFGATPSTLNRLDIPGIAGFRDGIGTHARFHCPWGLCLCNQESEIIVVDSNNSSLRRIDRDSGYVSTIRIQQDMSPNSVTGIVPQPTQLFYPTSICIARGRFDNTSAKNQHDAYIYVVSASCFQVLHIHLVTGTFHALHCVHNPYIQYRPVGLAVTATGCLIVGFTGYEIYTHRNNVKCVKFGDLELFSNIRRPIHYMNRGKIEFCACLCVSLAVNVSTLAVTLWITDAQAESRLLRVCLKLKWSFLRILLLAVRKPTHNTLFATLHTHTHGLRTFCPLLEHIVRLLQGVVAFA